MDEMIKASWGQPLDEREFKTETLVLSQYKDDKNVEKNDGAKTFELNVEDMDKANV